MQVPRMRFARVRNDKVLGLFRRSNGTKSPSLWFPAWLYEAVEVALVCRARLRQAQGRVERKAQVGGRERDRDRAAGQQAADHYQDGAPWDHYRAQGRGD